jgi:hypothetical protein
MKRKGTTQILLLIVIGILISLNYASAITAKIGNGRMTLNTEVGDVIDRTVLVINDNNVTVNITVSPAGGLQNDTSIVDKNFILLPGEQKNAEFIINVKQPGTTTTRINVQFSPIAQNKSGVGLSAQIIINAYGKGKLPQEQTNNETDKNPITGNVINEGSGSNVFVMMGIISLVLLVVLVFLLIYLSKKKSKKEVKRKEERQK